jgi:hypothetical protein
MFFILIVLYLVTISLVSNCIERTSLISMGIPFQCFKILTSILQKTISIHKASSNVRSYRPHRGR